MDIEFGRVWLGRDSVGSGKGVPSMEESAGQVLGAAIRDRDGKGLEEELDDDIANDVGVE
jgi:hypothetical protein